MSEKDDKVPKRRVKVNPFLSEEEEFFYGDGDDLPPAATNQAGDDIYASKPWFRRFAAWLFGNR